MGSQAKDRVKTVAILGAGPGGIVSAKEALSNGLLPTVFEAKSDFGGVWSRKDGLTYDSLITNATKYTCTFSDPDWTTDKHEIFLTAKSMHEFLSNCVDKFGIRKHIQLNCTVSKAVPLPYKTTRGDQGWEVTWTTDEGQGPVSKSQIFDAVMVSMGIFLEPYIPKDIKGLDTFPGKVIHSKYYKSGKDFKDQRVLILGGGISGVDIAGDVSSYTKSTIHSFRGPFCALKRYLPDRTRNNKLVPLDYIVFHNRQYMKDVPSDYEEKAVVIENKFLIGFCEEQQQFEDLRVTDEDLEKPISFAISDDYVDQVKRAKVVPRRQKILEIQGSKVTLENGETYEVDSIIMATGFEVYGKPIFPQDILDIMRYDQTDGSLPYLLFKSVLHPDLANLYFVSMYKGTPFPVMEQQAKWSCRLLSGKVSPPPRDVMMEGIKAELKIREKLPKLQLPHGDFFVYSDSMAKFSNTFPDLEKLESNKFTLAEALGRPAKGLESLESKKKEIYRMFMDQPALGFHYLLVENPHEAVKQMVFFETVLNE